MLAIRLLLAHRHLAALICAATLLLKVLVPAGYMIDSDHGRMVITVCSGVAPGTMTTGMKGMDGSMPGHGKSKEHGKAEMPCAFSGLSATVTGAIDLIQLASLIAFVMALGLAATMLPAAPKPAHLRPPLRGPPANL